MKRILVVLLALLLSCNAQEDCHEVVANVVVLSVRLTQADGTNVFDNTNFDSSLLKLFTLNANEELEFSALQLDDETHIVFQYVGDVIFSYDDINTSNLKFSNIQSQSNECGAITNFSFSAESNGQIICQCNFNDIIEIPFNI